MRIDDPTEPTDPIDTEAELAAAMDEGIEAATPEPAGEPPAEAPEGEEPSATEGEGEDQPEGAVPVEGKDKPAEKPDGDEPHEADKLGLKDKANARFRELTEEVKALAPIKEALDKAGIKDISELPAIIKRGDDGQFLLEQVQAVASPEQFGQTMDYLGLVKQAKSGDRESAEKAFAIIEGEYKALAQVLGKEVEGHDPLAEYPDLQADVSNGDVTKARALEIAAARTAQRVQQAARQQTEQTTRQQQEQQQAVTQARQSLNTLEAELKAADPHYAAKRPALVEKLKEITRDFPPGQWERVARLAYAAIPNPAPAQAKPTPGPMRPAGHRPAVAPVVFDDPEDALEAGIRAASAA